MKKKIFIAAAVIISSTAKAQLNSTPSIDTIRDLPEVSVTANKYPARTLLTGKVMNVVTRQQLERSGGKDLSQVLTEQAGLYINGANSNAGKDKSVYLRGARIDHTLIMLDGVPLYDASGIGSNFDIRYFSIDQVERIEILKGSQSTLYGSDAIAGVINIITRKASTKPVSFSGLLSYGSYRSFNGSAALSGSRKKWNYHIQYALQSTGGINEAKDTSSVPLRTDKDEFMRHALNVSAGFVPVNAIHMQAYFRYNRVNAAYDQGAFTDELDLNNRSENIQAGLKNEFRFGKATVNLVYNYSIISRIYTDDSVESRNGFAIYSKGDYRAKEHFADAFLVLPLARVLKLTAGIDYRRSSSDQSYRSISIYGPYLSELGKDSLHQRQLGIYAAMAANLKGGFNAEVGGRYIHHSGYGSYAVYNFNPSYIWKERWKVFTNLSSGFRSPSLYQLYSEYGNKKLDPEKAFSFDAGLQYFTRNKKLNGRATYFNRKVKDAIFFYTDPATYQSWYINQDRQHDQGVELELSLKPAKSLDVRLFYTYVDGKITTLQNSKDTSFFNLTRRPRNSFALQVYYQVTKALSVHSGLAITGKRTDIGYDAFFNQVPVKLKGYALWNLYASYSLMKGKISVFGDLRNVTNAKFTEVYGFNTMGINGTFGLRCNL